MDNTRDTGPTLPYLPSNLHGMEEIHPSEVAALTGLAVSPSIGPASDGSHPQPQSKELLKFHDDDIVKAAGEMTGAAFGRLDAAARQQQADDASDKGGSATTSLLNDKSDDTNSAPFYSVQYYRYLFNVDTTEVLWRLASGLMPIKNMLFSRIAENPDLYGPFWITTTAVFLFAITANIISWAAHAADPDWDYDFSRLTLSAALFYGFNFLVPAGIYLLNNWYSGSLSLAQTVDLYNYPMVLFLLFLVPEIVLMNQLVAQLLPYLTSAYISLILFLNLYPQLSNGMVHPVKEFVMGGICLTLLLYALLLRESFLSISD
eukprot:gnl/Spiro4/18727_TR10006_c0_g1_i1.p1 gnl/Spiro4/18727_TR10006_c0_g1~~gnl/Spiro4/18727_TR10006_c0_g1_i1.p1  ORF type:complete len:336 (+),score=77.34 gnl/Spiro4/18727_TR10006_c0_g1_i1:57-1010(+)